jgi:protein-L-isoaspartate(D-aspartate) O-methyltransferase
MLDIAQAKTRMIDAQLRRRGISNAAVLRAMDAVPRERFVEPGSEEFAYEDSPLMIGEGQTISQPYIVALMQQHAAIEPDDVVLEVGTGSGYAAAVMSRLAKHVFTIERHPSLAETAESRFRKLGYSNIAVRTGDGTKGWPEAGPFSAILVAAAGGDIPVALTEQLDIGGRLIIPVGRAEPQRLLKVTRTSATTFEEQDLGGVVFVPLVGAPAAGSGRAANPAVFDKEMSLQTLIAAQAEPLAEIDDPAFAEAFDRFADKRVVLLGEASHGTSEFYQARDMITRRLVERHGVTIVAVEADWPDAAAVDRYVRRRPSGAVKPEPPFQRFPRWMWRNREFTRFVQWLRGHNASAGDKAGFYGLDIYNMSSSIAAVLRYLDQTDPAKAEVARERYGYLTPWQNEPATYGKAVITAGTADARTRSWRNAAIFCPGA